jgi:hypothetical protein
MMDNRVEKLHSVVQAATGQIRVKKDGNLAAVLTRASEFCRRQQVGVGSDVSYWHAPMPIGQTSRCKSPICQSAALPKPAGASAARASA